MRWLGVCCVLVGCNGDIVVNTKVDDTVALSVTIQEPSEGAEMGVEEDVSALAAVSLSGASFSDVRVRWTFNDTQVCEDAEVDDFGDVACDFPVDQSGELLVEVATSGQAAEDAVYLTACGEEVCDGIDNDCDGIVDNDAVDAKSGFIDGDGDGYGGAEVSGCPSDTPWVQEGGDCDDSDPTAYPGADEYCDGVDLDCDGSAEQLGDSADCPATTCDTLLQDRPSLVGASGAYWIDAGDALDPFEVFCDLDDPAGGWTLVMDRRYTDPCWYHPTDSYTKYPEGLDQPTTLIDLSTENAALPDDRWVRIRDLSTETMARAEDNDASCVAADHEMVVSLSVLRSANCVPLGDTLNTSLLAHAENDCLGAGVDYSLWFGSNTGWHWLTTLSSLDPKAPFFTPETIVHPWQAHMFVR